MLTIHNMHCYMTFMRNMRDAIAADSFPEWLDEVRRTLRPAFNG